jgi:tRNA nucleotidyltransferase (CCA-adding enzyme)
MIETHITRYNEQQDKHRLNMMLYLEFIKHLLKIMRAIGIYGGHLVVVGLRGYATIELIKLASFI